MGSDFDDEREPLSNAEFWAFYRWMLGIGATVIAVALACSFEVWTKPVPGWAWTALLGAWLLVETVGRLRQPRA